MEGMPSSTDCRCRAGRSQLGGAALDLQLQICASSRSFLGGLALAVGREWCGKCASTSPSRPAMAATLIDTSMGLPSAPRSTVSHGGGLRPAITESTKLVSSAFIPAAEQQVLPTLANAIARQRTKDAFSRLVPAQDLAVEVVADDHIAGVVHDGGQLGLLLTQIRAPQMVAGKRRPTRPPWPRPPAPASRRVPGRVRPRCWRIASARVSISQRPSTSRVLCQWEGHCSVAASGPVCSTRAGGAPGVTSVMAVR